MKILGVVFQSTVQPNRLSLFCDAVESLQEGMQRATSTVIKEQGSLEWVSIITTLRDIAAPANAPIPSTIEVNKGVETTSWIMKTIITNKDTVLFDATKKYLSEPETLYVTDAIK